MSMCVGLCMHVRIQMYVYVHVCADVYDVGLEIIRRSEAIHRPLSNGNVRIGKLYILVFENVWKSRSEVMLNEVMLMQSEYAFPGVKRTGCMREKSLDDDGCVGSRKVLLPATSTVCAA